MKGSIAKNTAFDSTAQVVVMVASLIAGIILARTLGNEGRGTYVFATTFAGMILLTLTGMGQEISASVLAAKMPRRLGQLHTLIAMGSLLTGAVLWAIVWLAQDFFTRVLLPGIDVFSLYMVLAVIPLWNYLYGCFGLLIGMGRVRTRAAFDLTVNLTQTILVLTLLCGTSLFGDLETVRLLIFSYYAVFAMSAFFLYTVLKQQRKTSLWQWPSWILTKRFFSYGFWVYLGNMGANLGQRIDQYFVQLVSGSAGLFGVYTLSTALVNRTRIFPQALVRSTYARICSSSEKDAAILVAACFRQMLMLGLLLLIVGTALSPLIPLVYSSDFAGAVIPFVLLLVGRLVQSCGWMLPGYFTGHLGKPQIATVVNWSLLPLQGIAAFVAMQMGGLIAVAAITTIGYILHSGVFLVLFLRWQNHVGIKDLFAIQKSDFKPWGRLLASIPRLGNRR